MAPPDILQAAFDQAKNSFKATLDDEELLHNVLQPTTADNLWDFIQGMQAKKHNERRMQNLAKIKGFLDKLKDYAIVVDTFVQVKPDILALIWGPIRLLMVFAGNAAQLCDAIATAMARIGDSLPQFQDAAEVFEGNDKIRRNLSLFYGDLLSFYAVTLQFFKQKRRGPFFESIWPEKKAKIDVIVESIERHASTMWNEITIQSIKEENKFRDEALAKFDQTIDFQDEQRFQILKTRISPQAYDDRLDWLLNRTSTNSGSWLTQDKSFVDWLTPTNKAAQLLWLHGIPGAGKTFLSAVAIEAAKSRHRTVFVFVSHVYKSSTTAKSILQSLLFQLASETKDAKSLLVKSNERDLSGSTEHLSDLLKTLLDGTGPAYIIVDGLDEMDPAERGILLQKLSELSSYPEVRILVSSRPEDDIADLLQTKAVSIRVDKKNSISIHSYVTKRTTGWLQRGRFDQKTQRQIRNLLAPLASNACGMFLYARIVLDNAESFTSLKEIERELQVLPMDLNDVYHRILVRINELPLAQSQKARTILGWIGHAPVPMTQKELEQALLVDTNGDAAPEVVGCDNFVKICGPIIEMVDETPQFVHFTVKEYIFSRQIANYLDKAEANYSLSRSTLAYLCSGIHDGDLSDKQVARNILDGKYRLHEFATRQWVALVDQCVAESKALLKYPDLLILLRRLSLELRNYEYRAPDDSRDVAKKAAFVILESTEPELVQIIHRILKFRQDDRQTDWSYENDSDWVDFDPTSLSRMSARISKELEALLCPQLSGGKHLRDCNCAKIEKHYGKRPFKCPFLHCVYSHTGFPSRSLRKQHLENHTRPYKCSRQTCLYAVVGFLTSRARDDHWRQTHRSDPPIAASSLMSLPMDMATLGQLDKEQTIELNQFLVMELVKAGDVDSLHTVLQQPMFLDDHNVSYRSAWLKLAPARVLAARVGSVSMVRLLSERPAESWDFGPRKDGVPFIREVVRCGNPDLARWVLFADPQILKAPEYSTYAAMFLAADDPDVYCAFEDFLLSEDRVIEDDSSREEYLLGHDAFPMNTVHAWEMIAQPEKRRVLFSAPAFSAAKGSAWREARLVQSWHRLAEAVGGTLDERLLGWALCRAAKTNPPSVVLAAELLKMGAPVNFPRGRRGRERGQLALVEEALTRWDAKYGKAGDRRARAKHHKGMTALHFAAKGATEGHAKFLRWLLEQGADPRFGWEGRRPAQEKGAQLMEKWLGESWDEVVRRTGPKRREVEGDDEDGEMEEWDSERNWSGEDEDEDEDDDANAGKGKRRATQSDGADESDEEPESSRRRSCRVKKRVRYCYATDDEDVDEEA